MPASPRRAPSSAPFSLPRARAPQGLAPHPGRARFSLSLLLSFTLTLTALLAAPRVASAQVRWDASAQVGVTKRFLTGEFGQPSFGPMATIAGHVALIPLLRVGAYVEHDVAPLESQPARRFYAIGARAKLQAPWATQTVHGWAFAGAGYVGVYGPSESLTLVLGPQGALATKPSAPQPFSVAGAGGQFVEVPFGVGLGVRLRKPWELVFELGGRVGFAFGGTLYSGRTAVSETQAPQNLESLGKDSFAAFLSGGVAFEP